MAMDDSEDKEEKLSIVYAKLQDIDADGSKARHISLSLCLSIIF